MAKKRKKTRSRKTQYAPRRPKTQAHPKPAAGQQPATHPVEPQPQQPVRRARTTTRLTYAGRTAAHLAAMDLEKDEVMYSYVKKDLTRIGIFSAIMFGSLVVLKLLGVG